MSTEKTIDDEGSTEYWKVLRQAGQEKRANNRDSSALYLRDVEMNDRDLIAIAMLPAIYTDYGAHCRASGIGPQDEHWREELALEAYRMADAMIAMRKAVVP